MQKLRKLHLYLGCFFAPMLLFFAISGIWQTFGWYDSTGILKLLSRIHTSHAHKDPGMQLTSPFLALFVALMALALIGSIITGVILAFKFGRGKITMACLAGGILAPLILICLFGR